MLAKKKAPPLIEWMNQCFRLKHYYPHGPLGFKSTNCWPNEFGPTTATYPLDQGKRQDLSPYIQSHCCPVNLNTDVSNTMIFEIQLGLAFYRYTKPRTMDPFSPREKDRMREQKKS